MQGEAFDRGRTLALRRVGLVQGGRSFGGARGEASPCLARREGEGLRQGARSSALASPVQSVVQFKKQRQARPTLALKRTAGASSTGGGRGKGVAGS